MPVVIDISKKAKYEWRWPETLTDDNGVETEVNPEDQLVLKMRLLGERDVEAIDNRQFRTFVSQDSAKRLKKNQDSDEDLEFAMQTGSVRTERIHRSVIGWDNICNPEQTAIPFNHENLFKVIRSNAGFEPNEEGKPNLYDDLEEHITRENSLSKNPTKKQE